MKLDAIDRRILHVLQEDGRCPNNELARRAGFLPRRACAGCGCWKKVALSKDMSPL
nr:AsnC family protein [Acetobacter estunensis]